MEYIYQLAGIQIACSLPFPLTIKAESKEFLHQGSAQGDLHFVAQAVHSLPAPTGMQVCDRFYDGDTTWFCAAKGHPPYAMTQHTGNEIHCFYLEGNEHRLQYSANLCDLLGLERLLPLQEALLLHCSFVRVRGQAILFSGPSGVGKSTQAALWETHLSADLCNGDRAAIRFHEGTWQAHGLPYAGSSHVFRNASAPCRAIIMLGQGKENRLRRLPPREAFTALYPELTLHHWEKATVERCTTLLSNLISQIPVYSLECLPEEQAVQLLYQEVFP